MPIRSRPWRTAAAKTKAGDRDIIRAEHTLEIYENLPNAHLAIIPGATHDLPYEDPKLFNAMVFRFFQDPFSRPDSRHLFE